MLELLPDDRAGKLDGQSIQHFPLTALQHVKQGWMQEILQQVIPQNIVIPGAQVVQEFLHPRKDDQTKV